MDNIVPVFPMEHFCEIVRKELSWTGDSRKQERQFLMRSVRSWQKKVIAKLRYRKSLIPLMLAEQHSMHTLKQKCEELFGHIISSALDCTHTHGLYSDGTAPESVFCHLLQHLQEDENNILELLSCESSELFLRYFKDSLNELIQNQFVNQNRKNNTDIPQDFLINHISGSFVEMVLWWIKSRMKQTPEELDRYFRAVIEPIL